jgi:hypothetical protein
VALEESRDEPGERKRQLVEQFIRDWVAQAVEEELGPQEQDEPGLKYRRPQRQTAPVSESLHWVKSLGVSAAVQRGRSEARPGSCSMSGASSRGGDSGDEPGESEPPSRRLCAFCGRDIPAGRSPRAIYCSDRHADRDRQRRKRQRDRARDLRPRIPTTADFKRMLEISEEVAEKLREFSVCRCNGSHLELEPGECFRCGHLLPGEVIGGALLVDAFYVRLAEEARERRERAVAR